MTPKAPSARDNESNEAPRRKAYRTPQLQQYGDLAEITKTIVGTKTNDGGGHPNKHFTS